MVWLVTLSSSFSMKELPPDQTFAKALAEAAIGRICHSLGTAQLCDFVFLIELPLGYEAAERPAMDAMEAILFRCITSLRYFCLRHGLTLNS
jgi:hypothetical protein